MLECSPYTLRMLNMLNRMLLHFSFTKTWIVVHTRYDLGVQNFKRMSKTEDIVALTFFASAFLRGGRAVLKMFFYMRINPIFFIT